MPNAAPVNRSIEEHLQRMAATIATGIRALAQGLLQFLAEHLANPSGDSDHLKQCFHCDTAYTSANPAKALPCAHIVCRSCLIEIFFPNIPVYLPLEPQLYFCPDCWSAFKPAEVITNIDPIMAISEAASAPPVNPKRTTIVDRPRHGAGPGRILRKVTVNFDVFEIVFKVKLRFE